MLANFDVTPSFLFLVLLACNKLQPSKTQVDCSNYPCFNGGTCMPGIPDMCSCPTGFVQPFCTISCQDSRFPCGNGVCNGGVCNCPPDFTGPRCESAIAAYLSPKEITVTEGHVGHKAVTVQVCQQPSSEEVTLAVSITAGSALPDIDFVDIPFNARQDVTISAGRTCTPVNVFIMSDLIQEPMSKDFFLVLYDPQPSSSMVHIVNGNGFSSITITDDDPVNCDRDRPCFNGGTCSPSVSQNLCTCPGGFVEPFCTTSCLINSCQNGGTCNDDDLCSCQPGFTGPTCQSAIAVYLSPLEVSVTEGDTGDVNIQIHLCRQQSDLPATVAVTTSEDSASTFSDFAHIITDVTIPIGQVCVPVDISILSDMTIEPTEVFHVVILPIQSSSQVYVVPGQVSATVTIIDNDVRNVCASNPCQNGGICTSNANNNFVCQCPTGFTGATCTPIQNVCASNPCQNGGTCTSLTNNNFVCQCLTGYTGATCTQIQNVCASNPCQNGGTCTSLTNNNFVCQCPTGFTGATCTQIKNVCAPNPCQNGGICTSNANNNFVCQCPTGFTGTACTQDCFRLYSAGQCNSNECSCTKETCTPQTGRCEATCNLFQCPANIASVSLSQVNPQSSVEIKCILEGSTAVVNSLDIRLSRSEGAIDDHGITRETNPDISANRKEVTDRVISVSEDDQFFCIMSQIAIVGSINVTGFVYKLPSIRDPPTQLTRTTTSVTITWRPWDEETDVGDPPVVAYIPYYKMDPSQDWMNGSMIQADQTLEYTASSLETDRKYTFSVAAVREGEGGEGPRGPAVTIKTLCIEVVPQMVTTTLTATNDVTVTWQQPTVQCSTGITQFTIYYELEGDVFSRQEAGIADPNAESFTVNGSLLEPGTTYKIAVTVTTDQESALSEGRTVTATNPTGSPGSSVAIIIVAVIVVIIVLILLFLIAIVVRKRKMEDQPDPIDNQPLNDLGKQSGPSGNTYHSSGAVNTALNVTKAKKTKESSAASSSVIDVGGIYGNLEPPSPIRVAEFPEYIISNIDKVEHEFGLLEGSQQKHPWTVANQENNRKKNRFRNMYPYDHCRVVLPKLPGDHHSDYYNASFILNERDVRAYIASQGPNKASVDDFWRLIWEQNVQTIVMLANLYEEAKERCLQYWPKEENEIQSFGYIDVTWTKTQHFADYVIRTLSVDRGGTIREVKQLHFKEWPDKDIPENAMCLVEFARHCKLIHFKKQTPLLIHCSAGIGRTGTFIGLLSMMDVLQSKEYIDIFAFVNKMRENRVNMIQTKKQYRYLHTCLYEFHLTRDCQISSQILSRFKVHDNKAAILREFELLSEMEMSITNDSIKTGGTKDSLARGNSTDSLETDGSMTREHAPRDRFGNMVPVERRKVFMLSSSPSNPDNYINASFVKSYEKKDAFITTQSPLPNTIEDFWRMIYDHKCRTVVMLNQLDGSDKTCVQYWPDRGSLQYGIMTVACITTEQQSDYVKRTFDVTLNDSANVISVTHLQLEQWPPNGSPQSVIRLITVAQKLQKEANVDKPLVVHCINGFGRSGVFVTVQSEMERIRATGLVDIFATVKKLRNEHQHMMRKKMDYILCFDFLIEFSKRYGNYENW